MYSDTGLSVAISNPIVLNAAGRPVASAIDPTEVGLYPLSGSYKWIVKDANGATIWTQDNIPSVAIVAGTVTSVGLSMPSTFTVSNSPVTSTGTLAVTNAANTAFGTCHGRLTLTSGTAVTTGNVTGATNVYFTPFRGNLIDLFDGVSVWNSRAFTELTLPLGTLTSGLPYDIFAYDNSGVVALRSPVAWTSTTARATALTLQNGIYVKTSATTDRYLGTFYTTATTTTEDSAANRYLFNYYNRLPRELRLQESTTSWAYTTATWRQANAAAGNQVGVMIGVAEVNLWLQVDSAYSNTSADVAAAIAIGEDSTTTPLDTGVGGFQDSQVANANYFVSLSYKLTRSPVVGKHVYTWLEFSAATGAGLFVGNGGQTGNTHIGGIIGQTQA